MEKLIVLYSWKKSRIFPTLMLNALASVYFHWKSFKSLLREDYA